MISITKFASAIMTWSAQSFFLSNSIAICRLPKGIESITL
jgi:hypothetical protein